MDHTYTQETLPPVAKGRSGDGMLAPVAAENDLAFHALLQPNRSLTRDGFRRIMILVIIMNGINGVVYFTLGAWPVAFFCGVDILIVWLAFKISYAQGRRHERLMLTETALWVSRVLPSGHETRWKLTPAFVRVEIERPIDHDSQIRLTEHGKTLIVGSFLSPRERGEVADALLAVLAPRRL